MGSADIIPGVSGGTVALITGIYERLVEAIKSIDLKIIYYLFKGIFNRNYLTKSKDKFFDIKFKFLLPLAAGIVVAFLVLANILGWLLEEYPTYTYAFFFGLILSSAFFVYTTSKIPISIKTLIFLILGLLSGFYIVGLQTIQTDHSIFIVFSAGIITFCAMILPGLSGAFILLLLGQYDFMLDVLRGITHLDFSSISFAIAYTLGGIIGLIAFSRILSFLLRRHREITLSFIIGLMIGALRKPGELINQNPENIIITFTSAIIGIIIVYLISSYELKFKKTT
jgi:putative membrane protein